MQKNNHSVLLGVALAFFSMLCGLGAYQYQAYQKKKELAAIEEKTKKEMHAFFDYR